MEDRAESGDELRALKECLSVTDRTLEWTGIVGGKPRLCLHWIFDALQFGLRLNGLHRATQRVLALP